MDDLKKTMEFIAELDSAAEEDGTSSSVYIVATPAWGHTIMLSDEPLWSSDEDEREWDDDKDDYAETVEEFVLNKIEQRAKRMLGMVERFRNPVPEEAEQKKS